MILENSHIKSGISVLPVTKTSSKGVRRSELDKRTDILVDSKSEPTTKAAIFRGNI